MLYELAFSVVFLCQVFGDSKGVVPAFVFGHCRWLLFAVKGKGSEWFVLGGRKLNTMNIYVGNLAYRTSENELREQFGRFGTVGRVDIISDRETGRSKGFGFVEMPNNEEASAAIQALDGTNVGERTLKVNEARERPPRGHGGGGFGGGGGGGFSGERRSHRDRERY